MTQNQTPQTTQSPKERTVEPGETRAERGSVLAPRESWGGNAANHPISATHHAANHPISTTHHAANHPTSNDHTLQPGLIGKIPIQNVWFLMLYASELLPFLHPEDLAIEDNPDDIPELVARVLIELVKKRLKRNLTHGHQQKNDNLRPPPRRNPPQRLHLSNVRLPPLPRNPRNIPRKPRNRHPPPSSNRLTRRRSRHHPKSRNPLRHRRSQHLRHQHQTTPPRHHPNPHCIHHLTRTNTSPLPSLRRVPTHKFTTRTAGLKIATTSPNPQITPPTTRTRVF